MSFSLCVVTGCLHTTSGTHVCAVAEHRATWVRYHGLSISKASVASMGDSSNPLSSVASFSFSQLVAPCVPSNGESVVFRGAL